MKLRALAVAHLIGGSLLATPAAARAGGLFLPGSGAVSTARAGAAAASAEDGEALAMNPAGLAKGRGTTVTLSAALIRYSMQFTRTGAYEATPGNDTPYQGTPYGTVENDASPPLGLGGFQTVPVIAVASDLGGLVPGLRVAAGVYAPNAYPSRDMTGGYVFNGDPAAPPPPTRYDILEQEAVVVLPSLAVAYRITPRLDVGVRLSAGSADLKSTVAVWSAPLNYQEDIAKDGTIAADVRDGFVPAAGLGAAYRPAPWLELAAAWSSALPIRATGGSRAELGPAAGDGSGGVTIQPVDDRIARCARGGTAAALKTCVQLQLPMTAALGARYRLLDAAGAERADVELNLGWENWGRRCDFAADPNCTSPGQYRVVIDAEPALNGAAASVFRDAVLEHRLRDTYAVRLGGSYRVPLGAPAAARTLILRGGLAYDTRAAEDGWLRADLDGAARVTTALGASYRGRGFEVSIGGGYVYEGEHENPGSCNPAPDPADPAFEPGCGPGGAEQPIDERSGPDPVDPLITPERQAESPVGQGRIESSYAMVMAGVSVWF